MRATASSAARLLSEICVVKAWQYITSNFTYFTREQAFTYAIPHILFYNGYR